MIITNAFQGTIAARVHLRLGELTEAHVAVVGHAAFLGVWRGGVQIRDEVFNFKDRAQAAEFAVYLAEDTARVYAGSV